MRQEISFNEFIFVIIGFVIGSTIIIAPGLEAKNLTWLVMLISTCNGVVLAVFYFLLSQKNQGKSIVGICLNQLGPFFGRILAIGYIWYFFHLGALVVRNFSEYSIAVSFLETPLWFISGTFLVLIISLVRNGVETIVKVSQLLIPFVVIAVVLLAIVLTNKIDINNLKPLYTINLRIFLKTVFSTTSFPFGEIIVLTSLFPFVKMDKKNMLLFCGTLISTGLLLVVLILVTIASLGPIAFEVTFPPFSAARNISVFNFIERIEVLSSISYTFTSVIKVGVCMFAVCIGLMEILNLNSYQGVIIPIGILMGNLTILIYQNSSEMFVWALEIYPYYAFPFQILIPMLLFGSSIIKGRKNKKGSDSYPSV